MISNDKFILLIDNRSQQRLLRISDKKGQFRWRKILINLQQLIKYQYYQELQVGNLQLTPIEINEQQQQQLNEQEQFGKEQQLNNNKQIYTIDQPQKLQQEQIIKMKKNETGTTIIKQLIEGNQQYEKRSSYSKKKYLDKKNRKYLFYLHAQPINVENILNYYWKIQPKDIGWIRWDMLALMLLIGSPYGNVAIAQQTKGILAGSILQKSCNNIYWLHNYKKPSKLTIIQQLNIPYQRQKQKINYVNWQNISTIKIDNLLMLGSYQYNKIIPNMIPFLKNGSLICLYCLYLEPLILLLQWISQNNNNNFINIKLQDSWNRSYQILKNRTHPKMYMNSNSGYLLSAIKIQSN